MEDEKKVIKEDINFLEYPNWIVGKKSNITTWKIQKEHGIYEMSCKYGLPKHFDKIVLYYLLYKLEKETKFKSFSFTTTRYEIAKNVFPYVKDFGKHRFDRIMEALKKWTALSIEFEGLFFAGDGYTERSFHIIEGYTLRKETGELTINFNEIYAKQQKETKFYKLIDFEQYKKLHKGSSARLYEILSKCFKDRSEWAISIQLLAEKLTCEKRKNAAEYYPSDILQYIKPAINEINKKTDLTLAFNYNADTNICVFKKVKKQKNSFVPAVEDKESKVKEKLLPQQITACMNYFKKLSEAEQEEILDDINRQPFFEFIPDQNTRIFAYMTKKRQWKVPE